MWVRNQTAGLSWLGSQPRVNLLKMLSEMLHTENCTLSNFFASNHDKNLVEHCTILRRGMTHENSNCVEIENLPFLVSIKNCPLFQDILLIHLIWSISWIYLSLRDLILGRSFYCRLQVLWTDKHKIDYSISSQSFQVKCEYQHIILFYSHRNNSNLNCERTASEQSTKLWDLLRNIKLLLSIKLFRNKGMGENVLITWKAEVSILFTRFYNK